MPIPTNTVDSLIAAAKRELDAARRDGDATLIASALLRLNGRLDELPRCPTGNARMEC